MDQFVFLGLFAGVFSERSSFVFGLWSQCIRNDNMNQSTSYSNAQEQFRKNLISSNCIYEALDSTALRVLRFQYDRNHLCYFKDSSGKSCNDFIRTWCNEEGFISYPEYLQSTKEKEVLLDTINRSNEYARVIFSVNNKCNILDLMDKLKISYSETSTAGLVFWRLFKRLFYVKYKRPLPRCIWRCVADVFDKGNHHPAIMEDLVFMIWEGFHSRTPLIPMYIGDHKRIFTWTGDYKVYGMNGLDVVWRRDVSVPIPRYRNPHAWFEARVFKRKMHLQDNEPHMFTLLSEVTRITAEERLLNSLKNFEEISETAKETIGHTSARFSEVSESMLTAADRCRATSNMCFERSDVVTNGLQEVCDNLLRTSNALGQHVDGLAKVAREELIKVGSDFSTQVNNIGKVMETGTMGIYRLMGHKTLLVCEAFCLYVTRKYLPRYLWYFLLAQSVVRWFGLADYLAYFIDLIRGLISKYFSYGATDRPGLDNVPHGEEDEQSSSGLLAGTVMAAVGFMIYKGMPKGSKIDKFIRTIDSSFFLNRGMDNLPKLFDKISELTDKALAFFAQEEVPENDLGKRFQQHKNAYAAWSARVSELNSFDAKARIEKDAVLQEEVMLMRDEANVYVELFSDKRWPGHMKYTFNQAYRSIVELADRAEMVKSVELFRFDPYCVWIAGKPRAGKSFLATEVCRDLARAMGEPLKNSTYARGQTKHFDGYKKQPVAYFDDFGQWKGDLATERMSEFIACRSNHPFITPQADLSDKGRPFVSKAMVITSNFVYCDASNLVHDVGAVHSRRHLVIEVEVLPEYMDLKTSLPDIFKIQALSVKYPGEYRHLSCWICPPLPNSGTKEGPFTYADVQHKLLTQFKRYYSLQMQCINEYNEGILEDLRKRLGIPDNEPHAYRMGDKIYVKLSDFEDYPELQDLLRNHMKSIESAGEEVYELPEEIYDVIRWFDTSPDKLMPKVEFVDVITEEIWNFVGNFFMGINGRLQSIFVSEIRGQSAVSMKMREDLNNYVFMASGAEEMKGYWDRFISGLPDWRKKYEDFKAFEPIKKVQEHLAELAALAGVALMGVMVYKFMNNTDAPEAEFLENDPEMSHPSGDQRTARQSKTRVVRTKPKDNTAQGVDDSNTYDVLHNRFKRHLYWVKAGRYRTLGLAFDGSNLLVPHHLVAECKTGDDICLSGPNSLDPIYFKYDLSQCQRLGDNDAVVIRDIARLPPAPVLSKYFIRDRDLAKYRKFGGVILSRDTDSNDYLLMPCQVEEVNSVAGIHRHHRFGDGERYYVRDGWKHSAPTQRGMCMSPLFACGKRYERKAIGMHISSVRDEPTGGLALLITEEMLQDSLSPMAFDDSENIAHAMSLVEKPDVSSMVGTGYITLGKTFPRFAEFAATNTSLRPTKIFDMVRLHVTEPAILTRHDPRNDLQISPFRNALTKYEARTQAFHPALRRVVGNHLLVEHMTWSPLMPTNEISFDAMVNGYDVDGYKALEMDSSPGLPWKKSRPVGEVGKKYLFNEYLDLDTGRKLYSMGSDLWQAVVLTLRQLRDGIRPPSLWVHCTKDERRKMEKIRAVNTRIFTMAPVHITLACRALTLHFTAAFYRNMGKSYSAVGVDPHSDKWTIFMQKMAQVSTVGGDGDYGKYDGTLDPDLIMDAMNLIADWTMSHWASNTHTYNGYFIYTGDGDNIFFSPEQYRRALGILGVEFTHTTQIVFDVIHRKVQGNPSGNVLTVVLNTIVGAMYLRLAYLELRKEEDKNSFSSERGISFPSLRDYDRDVKDWIYGDDNLYAISPTITHWFNPQRLSQYFARYGITYTTADKSGVEQVLKPLSALRFLKRGWRRDEDYPQVFRAPIDVDTIYELTNWIRECPNEDEQLETQIEGALREAWAHGKEFYEKFLSECNVALKTVGMKQFANEYDMQTEHWRQSVLAW